MSLGCAESNHSLQCTNAARVYVFACFIVYALAVSSAAAVPGFAPEFKKGIIAEHPDWYVAMGQCTPAGAAADATAAATTAMCSKWKARVFTTMVCAAYHSSTSPLLTGLSLTAYLVHIPLQAT